MKAIAVGGLFFGLFLGGFNCRAELLVTSTYELGQFTPRIVSCSLLVSNIGRTDDCVTFAAADCGCLQISGVPLCLKPGESGNLGLVLDARKTGEGKLRHRLVLKADKDYCCEVGGEVVLSNRFDLHRIVLDIDDVDTSETSVPILPRGKQTDILITAATCSLTWIKAEPVPEKYLMKFKPLAPVAPGQYSGRVRLEITDSEEHVIDVPLKIIVRASIVVWPKVVAISKSGSEVLHFQIFIRDWRYVGSPSFAIDGIPVESTPGTGPDGYNFELKDVSSGLNHHVLQVSRSLPPRGLVEVATVPIYLF